MTGLPFMPYEGPEPFIFVSYAHKNKDKVYPIIKRLHEMGYRIWYDKGIPPSAIWMATIIEHLEKSSYVLLFVSPDAIASDYVFTEVSIACDPYSRIPLCPIYLEPTQLTPRFKGCIYILQAVLRYEHEVETDFFEALLFGVPEKVKKAPEPVPEPVPVAPKPKPVAPKPAPKPAPPFASPETDFEWRIDGYTAILVKYKGEDEHVVIPRTYQGKRVEKIEGDAIKELGFFSNDYIKSIAIPENVGSVGRAAFAMSHNLASVSLPSSLTQIGYLAFRCCKSLNNVIIPDGVTKLDSYTFKGCESLTDITIPASAAKIADNAFGDEKYPHNPALTFHTPKGSYAEQYAKEHGFRVAYTD